jgi:leucyl aminopeptidase (aminopeptidase T)
VRGGDKLTPEQLAAKGANDSLIHVDWMIGSGSWTLTASRPKKLPSR